MRDAKDAFNVTYREVLCLMVRPPALVMAGPLAKPRVYCHLPCQMGGRPRDSWGLLWAGRQDAWEDMGKRGFRGCSSRIHRKPDFITSHGTT